MRKPYDQKIDPVRERTQKLLVFNQLTKFLDFLKKKNWQRESPFGIIYATIL